MIRISEVFAAIGCVLFALPSGSVAQDTRTVMVVGNEICVRVNSGPVRRLTGNGVPKSRPVWSKDGARIAFIEKTERSEALARLVVIASNGRALASALIKPLASGEVHAGMRHVERLEWLTADRIAVSGSINPSTTEYNVFDLTSGAFVNEFFDDGHGAAFSPDGQHYAHVSGSPHFAPAEQRLPTLNVDGEPVFSNGRSDVVFAGKPRWSDDGKAVAVLAVAPKEREQLVVLWRRGAAAASRISVPFPLEEPASVSWSRRNLYVTSASSPDSAFVLADGEPSNRWAPAGTEDTGSPIARFETSRERLKTEVQEAGGQDADFWCEACDLTVLPRRSGER